MRNFSKNYVISFFLKIAFDFPKKFVKLKLRVGIRIPGLTSLLFMIRTEIKYNDASPHYISVRIQIRG
jgi:hypothetical protein